MTSGPPTPANFPKTVLLVDDEEMVTDLLSRALRRAGMEFVAVQNGRDAIRQLETRTFGCLVSDKNLPDINGVEVLRAARQLQPYCACIMITGYSTTDSVLEVLRMGASDYIEKPFPDLKLLVQRIQSAMSHQSAEFERNTLVEALHAMQSSLAAHSAEAFKQKTEREVLEHLVELRIEDATAQLSRQVQTLEQAVRSGQEIERALLQQLDALIRYVAGVPTDDMGSPSMVRGVLREISRRLEDSASLLRDSGDDEGAPEGSEPS